MLENEKNMRYDEETFLDRKENIIVYLQIILHIKNSATIKTDNWRVFIEQPTNYGCFLNSNLWPIKYFCLFLSISCSF